MGYSINNGVLFFANVLKVNQILDARKESHCCVNEILNYFQYQEIKKDMIIIIK